MGQTAPEPKNILKIDLGRAFVPLHRLDDLSSICNGHLAVVGEPAYAHHVVSRFTDGSEVNVTKA